jgi:hypothetical protein
VEMLEGQVLGVSFSFSHAARTAVLENRIEKRQEKATRKVRYRMQSFKNGHIIFVSKND